MLRGAGASMHDGECSCAAWVGFKPSSCESAEVPVEPPECNAPCAAKAGRQKHGRGGAGAAQGGQQETLHVLWEHRSTLVVIGLSTRGVDEKISRPGQHKLTTARMQGQPREHSRRMLVPMCNADSLHWKEAYVVPVSFVQERCGTGCMQLARQWWEQGNGAGRDKKGGGGAGEAPASRSGASHPVFGAVFWSSSRRPSIVSWLSSGVRRSAQRSNTTHLAIVYSCSAAGAAAASRSRRLPRNSSATMQLCRPTAWMRCGMPCCDANASSAYMRCSL